MQKVLLQGRNLIEIRDLKNDLEAKLPYQFEFSLSHKETLKMIEQTPFGLFINTPRQFSREDCERLREIRGAGFNQPLLIAADEIDDQAMRQALYFDKVHFTENPIEIQALKGLVLKLIRQRNIPQQKFKRFRTNQSLAVESYSTGEVVESSMFNLSVGGAYFESQNKCHAGVGDLLKMTVSLNDVSSQHLMNARVIWTTRKGHYSGGYGMGVRFVKNEEVYKELLGQA